MHTFEVENAKAGSEVTIVVTLRAVQKKLNRMGSSRLV
jgi:hypothetical protein